MKKGWDLELKVGIFVIIGTLLMMVSIMLLGGATSIFSRHNRYYSYFDSADGIIQGSKVTLNGIRIGVVENIDLDQQGKSIKLTLQVEKKYEHWIRKNTTAEIVTQGMLGDKYIYLSAGDLETEAVTAGSEIPKSQSKDLKSFLSDGEKLMTSLTSIATNLDELIKTFNSGKRAELLFDGMSKTSKNLSEITKKINKELDSIKINSSVKHLNSILEKIDNGEGTLGALINDPALYEDAKSLVGGANRNRIVRNLVRKTIKDSDEKKN